MKIYKEEVSIETTRRFEIVDITSQVVGAVEGSGVKDGFVLVHTPHATCAVRVNENEPRLHQDMERFLQNLSGPSMPYRHDAETVDDRPNAWAHILALLMNASASIPVSDGTLEIGRWQSVFLVELDGPRKVRKTLVRVYGG